MEVSLTEVAQERLRALAEGRYFDSPEQAIEVAMWGADGPAVELSERDLHDLLSRDRSGEATIPADEVLKHIRAHIAERDRVLRAWARGVVPSKVFLQKDACLYLDAFVRTGAAHSREEAIEQALLTALELAPPGTDGSPVLSPVH